LRQRKRHAGGKAGGMTGIWQSGRAIAGRKPDRPIAAGTRPTVPHESAKVAHFPLAPLTTLREAWRMEDLALTIRAARPDDAAEVARIYIESWHDTYPAVLSSALLCSMTLKGQTARWRSAISNQRRETVLVAENAEAGLVGMASLGPSRDRALGYDAELYTLYVDPSYFGRGAGRALLKAAFSMMRQRGCSSCVIWAHAGNNARFFYETMGGRVVAERKARMMGDMVPEVAFGWKTLALAERSHAK
jgi:GNAT superfamily N-acetyltransferase